MIRPLEPVTWVSVPLALRITLPDATSHALRLTLRRRRLPHGEKQFIRDGSPIYPKVTGDQAAHCFWCYTRVIRADLLPGFCRFRPACASASGVTRSARHGLSFPPPVLTP